MAKYREDAIPFNQTFPCPKCGCRILSKIFKSEEVIMNTERTGWPVGYPPRQTKDIYEWLVVTCADCGYKVIAKPLDAEDEETTDSK